MVEIRTIQKGAVLMNDINFLDVLRKPFPAHQISKLPKPTKKQTDCDYNAKVKCGLCEGFHHPDVIHLDYVGHAALTDRLLDVDPLWYWEPIALAEGLPAFDASGGLWIRLFICGHSRIGYGHAAQSSYKEIGSREKEVIGDALRNSAMRFGCALDLWHKGDLHDKKLVLMGQTASDNIESIMAIKSGIANNDLASANEAWVELTKEEKEALWVAPSKGGIFTTQEISVLKSKEFREANQ